MGLSVMRTCFQQIWVHGSHYESCLMAVVVPVKGRLQVRWCLSSLHEAMLGTGALSGLQGAPQ